MKSVSPLYLAALVLMIVLVFPVCAVYANTQTPSHNKRSGATVGAFKVWVPAGIIGDKYWIYLDGHIVSAPPHATTDPKTAFGGKVLQTPDGWEIYGRDGLTLSMIHENWDRSVTSYMDSAGDPLHLFQGFIFSLPPGTHTIELAILQFGQDFPFVFTGKWVRDIRRGETTRIFVATPDDWRYRGGPAASAARAVPISGNEVCSFDEPAPPDVDGIVKLYNRFNADLNVIALRGVDASALGPGKGVAVLDLPAELGGSREFDARQLREIAHKIDDSYPLPPLSDVAECQRRFPRLSSYGDYGKVISLIDGEIKSFYNLAAKLERGH